MNEIWIRIRAMPRWLLVMVTIIFAVVIPLILAIGAFPVSLLKGDIEKLLSEELDAPATVGSIGRRQWFSFSPDILIEDVRVAQPGWAGKGSLFRVRHTELRVPLWSVLIGRPIRPSQVRIDGLEINYVRDARGRSNLDGKGDGERRHHGLEQLRVTNGRFTLRDAKRHLDLEGTLRADERGVLVAGTGIFHDARATMRLSGPSIAGRDASAAYPIAFRLQSPLLDLAAKGETHGALNLADMTLDISAKAPDLKYLDDVIEAGLFGTQPIDLRARVRHDGKDWHLAELAGSIGRSRMTGKAEILKREGRTKIDATVIFSQLDFDDLADDAGLAAARALEARIGPRVIPNTRISLAKVGPTDGVIHFRAEKLLFRTESVFRTLAGDVRLEGKHLALENVVSQLRSGRMTGRMDVRQKGETAQMDVDLLFEDGQLGTLLGAADKIEAPFRARVRFSGPGDTIRDAVSAGSGRIGIAALSGRISRRAAAVLGQDLGKTIGAVLGDKDETVPLHCVAVRFGGEGGVLLAREFAISTGSAKSRGIGRIDMKDESIALTIGGRADQSSGLDIVDPVTITGTLSNPKLSFAGMDGSKSTVGSALEAFGKSIGAALGLAEKHGPAVPESGVDCAALAKAVLQ